MDILYCPWRSRYCASQQCDPNDHEAKKICVFCSMYQDHENEDQQFILKRYNHTIVHLNLYPYNAGHLLVVPLMHVGQLHHLSHEALNELMDVISLSSKIVQETLRADGVNIGCNIGNHSGGSITSHLHAHVLPRWEQDTNFLPTLSHTKHLSFDLHDIYQKLKSAF
ncbi:MAG: HIT domain-containing protein [Candidatus Babeliales bacterium]